MVESVLSVQFGAACDGCGGANCCMWSVGFSKGLCCEGTAAAVLDDDIGASFGDGDRVF